MLKTLLLPFAVAFAAVSPAYADVVGCPGQFQTIELRANGLVIGDWGYGSRGLCSLSHDISLNGETTTRNVCTSYYAALLTAAATHQQITTFHHASTCSAALAESPTPDDEHLMTVPPYGVQILKQ